MKGKKNEKKQRMKDSQDINSRELSMSAFEMEASMGAHNRVFQEWTEFAEFDVSFANGKSLNSIEIWCDANFHECRIFKCIFHFKITWWNRILLHSSSYFPYSSIMEY